MMHIQNPSPVRFGQAKTDLNFIRFLVEQSLKDNKINSFSKVQAIPTLGILIWTQDATASQQTIQALQKLPQRFVATNKPNEFLFNGKTKVGVWVDGKISGTP